MKENDKELLELAAKAAGIKGEWCAFFGITGHGAGQKQFGIGDPAVFTWGADRLWNPLEDDGDALRVARVVGMTIYFDSANQYCMMEHGAINGTCAFWGEYGDHSNMREAITWLAAQIGKTMP